MKLKKIIISGFKSFADRVTLMIDDGITGVIGPNGSGKSNVIDAVRWVMGEQNAKHLRGNVATDIIFSGSDKRKPLSMAEVTLIFDNSVPSDFCPPEFRHESEISLTRRIYVDGEREYYINKKACRLKDIVSFFALTGLGGRSYSMIQQGQVDRVLNARPEDVREILEEAAGIKVFKQRKEAAEKKLQTTKENLARIEDIITELDRQLKSLKSQVEKAQKYHDYSSELKEDEVALFRHNFNIHFSKLLALTGEINSQVDLEVESMAKLAKLQSEHEKLQAALDEADPSLEKLRESLTSMREHIARAESTIKSSQDIIENSLNRLQDLENEVKDEQSHLQELETLAERATEDLRVAEERVEEIKSAAEGYEEEFERNNEMKATFESRIGDIEDEIRNLDSLLESNRLRCEAIERDRKRAIDQADLFIARIDEANENNKKLEGELEAAKATLAEKQSGAESVVGAKQTLEANIRQYNDNIANLSTERDCAKEKYLDAKVRVSSLKDVELTSSRAGTAYKTLKENEGDLDSLVVGLLVDFISMNSQAEEMSPRARICFEKWAERFVIKDVAALNEFAKLVGRHKLGDIPLLMSDFGKPANDEATKKWAEKYDAICLSEYVNFEKGQDFLKPLLSRLYYIPAVELEGSEIVEKPEEVIVFSGNGVVFSSASEYLLYSKEGASLLSKKTEIKQIEQDVKEFEKQLSRVQNELDRQQSLLAESKQEHAALVAQYENQNAEILSFMKDYQSIVQTYDHRKDLLNQDLKQRDHYLEVAKGFAKELGQLGEARISLGTERDTLVEELESLQQESGEVEERWEELKRINDNRKIDLAKAETKLEGLRQSFHQGTVQLERLQQGLSRRYEERERLKAQIEQSKVNQAQCQSEIQHFIEQRDALETELNEKRGLNEELARELRLVEKELKKANDEYAKLKDSKSQKSTEIERARMMMENISASALEKYGIVMAEEKLDSLPNIDTEKKAKNIERLKKAIEALGPVNMVAIQEYQTLSERHGFILGQQEEVIGSIRLLEDAIFEIQETAKDKFLQTFGVVNGNFQQLFPILFPGGEAFLQLTSTEDPLTAGVDIMVRLPGKKQQPLNLFSGGEKALTAISLIFALLKTKPTPFCFLDEVDAPLDEANVGRYNKVLQALSDKFQFIVITHNRRTMEVLDQLYGITMQEGGVSKVVGVDLKKDLPAHLQKELAAQKAQTAAAAQPPRERQREPESAL
jgi:chromosome segregation protein